MSNWRTRGAALLLAAAALWYTPWMLATMNGALPWLSVPFVAANLLIVASAVVTCINNWHRGVPTAWVTAPDTEPPVAVIIPTAGEPIAMVARTARSVLDQDWPHTGLRLIISDDAGADEIAGLASYLQNQYPTAIILYHRPPRRGTPERRGDAKAGNLNSALDLLFVRFPEVAYVETRDADDEVGDRRFLRHCIGQLQVDERVAYVQTIKQARVSEGDPFNNEDLLFYHGSMLARHAANAVFPCGSGLVWRLAALQDIGGFPTWNLVEDLQSGVEALRRGWRGVYLPIVGVVSQHAPEDIPNVYKQRGVWALDTMRLLFWGNLRGLNLRQRLHFYELGLFYLASFAMAVFIIIPALSFVFHIHPLTTDHLSYAVHFWPFAGALELFLATLNGTQPYESLWKARQMWLGLGFVYMRACTLALTAGPHRKPVYRVTRKTHHFNWYWRETLAQGIATILLGASLIYGIATTPLLSTLDLGSAFWAFFLLVLLVGFMPKSWFGLDWYAYVRTVPRSVLTFILRSRPSPASFESIPQDVDAILTGGIEEAI